MILYLVHLNLGDNIWYGKVPGIQDAPSNCLLCHRYDWCCLLCAHPLLNLSRPQVRFQVLLEMIFIPLHFKSIVSFLWFHYGICIYVCVCTRACACTRKHLYVTTLFLVLWAQRLSLIVSMLSLTPLWVCSEAVENSGWVFPCSEHLYLLWFLAY